jgi:hypothetical protein
MYLIWSGLVWSDNGPVNAGSHVGEDMICRSAVRNYDATTMTYVTCTTLNHRSLHEVLDSCPTFRNYRQHIRYCAARMALRMLFRRLGRLLLDAKREAEHITAKTNRKTGVLIVRAWHPSTDGSWPRVHLHGDLPRHPPPRTPHCRLVLEALQPRPHIRDAAPVYHRE